MRANVFFARCITNLHVGNGDVNYSIIDQEVEKDPITGHPMINSSGVKGALRDFFENMWGKNDPDIKKVFGGTADDMSQGAYKFLQMDMLFRPLRVTNGDKRSHVLSTTEEIINGFADRAKSLGMDFNGVTSFTDCNDKVSIEGNEITLKNAKEQWTKVLKDPVAFVRDINMYDLPVIARNSLDDNGISKNLWYEEFVPHESIFGLIILTPVEMDKKFMDALTSEPIQFGGNASIGYGLMEIKEA